MGRGIRITRQEGAEMLRVKVTAVRRPPITEGLNEFLQQCILAFGDLLSSKYPAWGLSETPRWCDTGFTVLRRASWQGRYDINLHHYYLNTITKHKKLPFFITSASCLSFSNPPRLLTCSWGGVVQLINMLTCNLLAEVMDANMPLGQLEAWSRGCSGSYEEVGLWHVGLFIERESTCILKVECRNWDHRPLYFTST
jgi:hypothetical protein